MKYFLLLLTTLISFSIVSAQDFIRFGGFSTTSGLMILANIDTIDNPDIIHRSGPGFFGNDPVVLEVVLNAGLDPDNPEVLTIAAPADIGSGIAAADMDGDGDTDLITSRTGETALYLFDNQGAGTFDTSLLAIAGVEQLLIEDMNGDDLPDIIGTSASADQLTVWLNDGAGGFNETQIATFDAFNFVTMAVGDIDADDDQDIVICYDGFANNNLVLYLNNGDLTFTASNPRPQSVRNPLQVKMEDFNNDGLLDILVADRSEIFVVPQTEVGFGAAQTLFTSFRRFNSFAFGDFDENGLKDVVIGGTSDARDGIILYANYGVDTTYSLDSIFVGPNRPTFNMVAADMDLDGDVDLVTTNGFTYYFRNDLEKVPVSINEGNDLLKELTIYPNPAGDKISVTVPEGFRGALSLCTIEGREVLRRTNFTGHDIVSLADLQSGLFVVIIRDEETGHLYRSIGVKQ